MISKETIICRKGEDVMTSELGDELVMMHMEHGVYISLNKVGRKIWEMAETPVEINSIITDLLSKYKVDEERCSVETLECIRKMIDQEIVSIVENVQTGS